MDDKSILESVMCLHPSYALDYLKQHQDLIVSNLEKFPWIFFSSSKDIGIPSKGLFDGFGQWMAGPPLSLKNDGLVPSESGQLMDFPHLVLDHFDHASPVMDLYPFYSIGKEERLLFTRVLIQMIYDNTSWSLWKRTKHE
jgi:hypothetical protein